MLLSNCKKYIFFLLVILNGCSFCFEDSKKSGVVLGFDDYYPMTWEQHFDLFDKYGATVTFFVLGDTVSDFMTHAINRGHEIGYHTISHLRLSELSKEQFFEETISRISIFRDAGVVLTSFAYPFGNYETWMHSELLQYYKIVRGFDGKFFYTKNEMKSGFISSKSIDNINYKTVGFLSKRINLKYKILQDMYFKRTVNKMFRSARKQGKIITLTSHCISDKDWGITPKRLEYVLRKGKKCDLTFYTYKSLQ